MANFNPSPWLAPALVAATAAIGARLRRGSRASSDTIRLYRASHGDFAKAGSSFARKREHAEAYLDNPGFGGPVLYYADIRPTLVLRVNSLKEAREAIAETLIARDMGFILKMFPGLRYRAPWVHGDEVTAGDIREVISGSYTRKEGYEWPHQIVADGRLERELLAMAYDWVVHPDSFPEGCETWTFLGEEPIELTEVEGSRARLLPERKPVLFYRICLKDGLYSAVRHPEGRPRKTVEILGAALGVEVAMSLIEEHANGRPYKITSVEGDTRR